MSKQSNLIAEWTCPMPDLDSDIITLGHGSGGQLTHQLLESGIFPLIDNEYLKTRHDGAVFSLPGKLAYSTDSYVVSPIFFPGGNIGDLAINGTVNDLAMCGAVPKYLSLGLILEEGLKMEELWNVLISMKRAADKAKVIIVTGDTKVVERGKADKLFINTTGIGQVHPKAVIDIQNIHEGDAIVITGNLGTHGITILSQREGLTFETSLQSDTRPVHDLVKALLDEFGSHVHLLRDPTRGGVATVLNEIAKHAKVGVAVNEVNLPILPEVSGACEMLGLDPMYVANEGILIAFIQKEFADAAIKLLRSMPGGEDTCEIGEAVSQHPGQVVMKSTIGGRRIIQMLPGDQLPRIC